MNKVEKYAVTEQHLETFRQFLIDTTLFGRRMIEKPAGYAGDAQTIKILYENQPVNVIDAVLLDTSAAKAVRNRRALVARHLINATNITSLACGPAEEIFDVGLAGRNITCVDMDQSALDDVAARSSGQINTVRLNLLKLIGGAKLPATDQDVVYSIGLIDYFSDKLVVGLLNRIYEMLKPGGFTILGNFHPRNPTRTLMDEVLDWKLIHRTEADMERLFSESAFGKLETIEFEPEQVNLFAFGVKSL